MVEAVRTTLHYTALIVGSAVLIVGGVVLIGILAQKLVDLMAGTTENDK